MPQASYVQSSFLGGEWSQTAIGNIADPKYKISMNICFNGMPMQPGAWTRRPGTAHAGFTRQGQAGRVQSFDFEEASPYIISSTNGYFRFWCSQGSGLVRVTTNDSVAVSALSSATPAAITLALAVTWATGDTVFFSNLGTPDPALQNRTFLITKTDTTHFTLADELTGASFNGTASNALFTSGTINHIHEVATPYIGTTWSTNRMVQTEENAFMLNAMYPPEAINVTLATSGFAQFAVTPANFLDGPYLDAFTNGVQITPNQTTGLVSLALSFPLWNQDVSYALGSFVSSDGKNYQSLIDQNVGAPLAVTFSGGSSPTVTVANTFTAGEKVIFFSSGGTLPVALTAGKVYYVLAANLSTSVINVSATSGGSAIDMATAGTGAQTVVLAPAQLTNNWTAATVESAINNGAGFLASDIGRSLRLFSEPPLWLSSAVYTAGTVVSYNPTGKPGASSYWQALTSSNTANVPGSDNTNWQLVAPGAVLPSITGITPSLAAAAGPAQWSWGKIVSLVAYIPGTISGAVQIGNMTAGGGNAAAFNGTITQNAAASAGLEGVGAVPAPFVGQNYGGSSPSSYAVQSATIYPSTDKGFVYAELVGAGGGATITATAYLYGSASSPASGTAGTLLGSTFIGTLTFNGAEGTAGVLGTSAINITSSSATTYQYVWVYLVITNTAASVCDTYGYISQIELVNTVPNQTTSNGCTIELLGPPLLYTSAITAWRLGAYSATTGYPTCGTYADGRLWLSGVIPNRLDACRADGIVVAQPGQTTYNLGAVNFAPTDQYGNVTEANAISYTFNFPGSNPVFWMEPDLQGIICGTQAGEILVYAPGGGGLSPLDIAAKRATKVRCANILPVRCEHTLVFAQAHQRKIMEYFADIFSGKFSAPDLTEKCKHMTVGGIAELAYQQELIPTIWARLANGGFFGMTYKRDTLMTSTGPTFNGAHRHALGSGYSVASICAGPSENGNLDALVMVTNDGTYYHVEQLTDLFEEADPIVEAQFLDCSITNVSYNLTGSTFTIQGLWPLNGASVGIFAGGYFFGHATVSSGQITQTLDAFQVTVVQSFSGNTPIAVGFTYESDGQVLRHYEPQDAGTRTGPALGNRSRTHKVAAKLVATQAISFGSTFTGANSKFHVLNFTQNGATTIAPATTLQTGVFIMELDDEYSLENSIAWKCTDSAYPATVGNISGKVETADI